MTTTFNQTLTNLELARTELVQSILNFLQFGNSGTGTGAVTASEGPYRQPTDLVRQLKETDERLHELRSVLPGPAVTASKHFSASHREDLR